MRACGPIRWTGSCEAVRRYATTGTRGALKSRYLRGTPPHQRCSELWIGAGPLPVGDHPGCALGRGHASECALPGPPVCCSWLARHCQGRGCERPGGYDEAEIPRYSTTPFCLKGADVGHVTAVARSESRNPAELPVPSPAPPLPPAPPALTSSDLTTSLLVAESHAERPPLGGITAEQSAG